LSPFYVFIFFSLSHPPPRSTLFPYTTLFRSWNRFRVKPTSNRPKRVSTLLRVSWRGCRRPYVPLRLRSHPQRRRSPGRKRISLGDRKSTRLNSSHLGISYAVFCLKKKKDSGK